MNKIKTMKIQQGGIYLLKDQKPTGNTLKHNYIVLTPSEKINNAQHILCVGLTSCKHGGEGVIPIECTNGDITYINIQRTYLYKLTDFEKPICHGFIDIATSKMLLSLVMVNLGLPVPVEEMEEAIDFYRSNSITFGNEDVKMESKESESSSLNIDESVQKIERDITADVKNNEKNETMKKPRLNYNKLYATELMPIFAKFKHGINAYAKENDVSLHCAQYRQKVLNDVCNKRIDMIKNKTLTSFTYKNVGFWSDEDLIIYDSMVLNIIRDDKTMKPANLIKFKELFNFNNIDEIMLKCKSVEKEMKRRNIDIGKVTL